MNAKTYARVNGVIKERNTPVFNLSVGHLAFLDSFLGLIPCKVLGISEGNVKIKIMARNCAVYPYGTIETFLESRIVPREAVYKRNGQFKIRAYTVIPASFEIGG